MDRKWKNAIQTIISLILMLVPLVLYSEGIWTEGWRLAILFVSAFVGAVLFAQLMPFFKHQD
jgi:heme/copper-type cytochrome/quinol oxidase subunit 4